MKNKVITTEVKALPLNAILNYKGVWVAIALEP